MPGSSCWASFTSCWKKTGTIVENAIPILNMLSTQAKLVLTALISAGVVKAEDPNVALALDALGKIQVGLEVSGLAMQELIKYIPKNIKDIADLNNDGVRDTKDMVLLLQSGKVVLDQLITKQLVTSTQATLWLDAFNKLIIALQDPAALTTTAATSTQLLRTNGAIRVPRIEHKSQEQLVVENADLRAYATSQRQEVEKLKRDNTDLFQTHQRHVAAADANAAALLKTNRQLAAATTTQLASIEVAPAHTRGGPSRLHFRTEPQRRVEPQWEEQPARTYYYNTHRG